MGKGPALTTGARVFVEVLKTSGVEVVFSVPGTTLLDVYDVLREERAPRLVVARHEQAAAMMADGYARASGRPGVVLVSRAPALCNTAIGLYGAHTESVPLLVVNGSPPLELANRDCFEEMDIASFAAPLSKWYVRVDRPGRIAETTARALRECLSGRPRPVVMSFPIDMQQAEAGLDPCSRVADPGRVSPAVPSDGALAAAADLFRRARRPLLLLGGGSRSESTRDPLVRTAEVLQAPVVAAWGRTDAFPNSHPLYCGTAGPGAFEVTKKAMREADLVLAIGCRFSEFTTQRYTAFGREMRLIQVDVDPYEIGKIYPAEVAVQADAGEFLRRFCARFPERESGAPPPREWVQRIGEEFLDEKRRSRLSAGTHPRLRYTDALRRLAPRDALFVIDCATFGPWLTRYFGFDRPNSALISAAGCLGFGFPGAMGAQLAVPRRKVVAVVGDGSFLMCLANLATAVRERIPLTVVVMNNSCYGNIAERQKAYYGNRLFGCDLNNPDFARVAEEFGARGFRAESPEQFEAVLPSALSFRGPSVIDVIEEPEAGLPGGATPLVAR